MNAIGWREFAVFGEVCEVLTHRSDQRFVVSGRTVIRVERREYVEYVVHMCHSVLVSVNYLRPVSLKSSKRFQTSMLNDVKVCVLRI